jgi:hypothetical protein
VDSLAIADLAEQRHRAVYYRSANARVRRIKERLGSTQPEAVPVGSQPRIWIAVALCVGGLAALIDQLAPSAQLFGLARDWWPMLLVLAGLGGAVRLLLETRNVLRGPVFLTLAGMVLLLVTLDPLPSAVRPLLVPALLILLGGAMLVRLAAAGQEVPERAVTRLVCIAEARRVAWPRGEFSLGTITTVASGCVIDLTRATPLDNVARLDITAALSGVDLRIPDGWRVTFDSHRVAGRCPGSADDRPGVPGAPTLEVKALVIGAGIEVRYEGGYAGSEVSESPAGA